MNAMATNLKSNGVELNVEFDAHAGGHAPVVMFSNSLGTHLAMWDEQAAFLSRRFRVLRYDTRGHGDSALGSGPCTFEQLGRDALGILDALEIERAFFCGLSMGGVTGQWIGLHAPERLQALVLCNTAARIGTAATWDARIAAVRSHGMSGITEAVLERWFTAGFRKRHPGDVETVRRQLLSTLPEGYARSCEALRDVDYRHDVGRIRVPTLVIAGSHDPATPPADGRYLAEHIVGARYAELDAAHLSNIEQAAPFNQLLSEFLEEHSDG